MSLRQAAREIASEVGIDPDLFLRLVQAESSFDPNQVSEDGAVGLTQIMEDTGNQPGYNIKPIEDRYNPIENLRFGAEYYKAMKDKYGSDEFALMAYHAGPGNADKIINKEKGLGPKTESYIEKILGKSFDPSNKFDIRRIKVSTVNPENPGALNNISSLDNYGSLTPELLAAISGSPETAQQAIALAQAMRPKAPEFDPAMASLLYFTRMGELANQPGSTVLGSAVGAISSPVEYLMQQRQRQRQIEDNFPSTAIGLAKALKTTQAGSTTLGSYILQKDIAGLGLKGTEVTLTNANAAKLLEEDPNSIIKKPTSSESQADNVLVDVVLKNAVDDPSTPDLDERIIKIKRSDFDPNIHLPVSAIDQTVSDDSPSSQIAKLYNDLSRATEGSPEHEAIKKQIDNEVKKAEFAKDIFGAEKDLRSEWTKVSTPFQKVEGNHKKLKAALLKQTGVGDMSAIFMYMKMLDPGSVVRESEFSAAQQTAGVMQQVIILGKQLMKGDKLTPSQRDEFLSLAETFFNVTKDYTDQKRINLQFVLENNPVLKFKNVFGNEFPPPSFYLKPENIDAVKSEQGMTMQKLWGVMTDAEKREYE